MSGLSGRLLLAGAALALSVLVAVVAFETVERARYERWRAEYDNAGWFGRLTRRSENPVLLWEYRPYGEVQGIATNRFGFRDRDYESIAKPDGLDRSAFIGDSVTLGMMVGADDTFVRVFERTARQRRPHREIQALNFGIDGYNALQIRELLRARVLAWSPDRVIYVMCMNDFDFEESSGLKIQYFKRPRSFLVRRIQELLRRLSDQDFHLHHFEKNREVVYAEIQEMQTLARRDGAEFHVVLLPVFDKKAPDFADYPLRGMHDAIRAFLDQRDIAYIDLLDSFAASGETQKHYAIDEWHPRTAGHAFIGQELAVALYP